MSIRFRSLAVLTAFFVLLSLSSCKKNQEPSGPTTPSPGAPSVSTGKTGTASITGTVTFKGTAPKPKKIDVGSDPYCVKANPGGLTVSAVETGPNGALKGALVYVKTGISGVYPAPSTPVVLDQHNCWYHPAIVAVQAGQPIEIKNSDNTTHNVRTESKMGNSFNMSENPNESKSKTLETPENQIPVACDVHPWMKGYLFVFAHPFFAVTGDDGKFSISGLPAGEYEVEVFHPELGTSTQKVTVAEGQSAEASFTLEKKA